ncbi:MAG: DUF58 domain-containing protein [bacterium]
MSNKNLNSDVLKIFTPEYLSKLSGLDLIAKLVVEGYFAGLHRSIYKGFSVEFAEHRPYYFGDDIRHIDWKVFAKRDRYFIKEFEAETSLQAVLVIDASNSMGYSKNGRVKKIEYTKQLASALSYILIHQRDSVGLALITDRIEKIIHPRSTIYHLYNLFVGISQIEYGGKTDLGSSLIELGERLTRRSLIILISDLWDDEEKILDGARAFREKKNEFIIFQILDKTEAYLASRSPVVLKELEGKEKVLITDEVIKSYRISFEERQRRIKNELLEIGVDYQLLYTDTPHYVSLTTYLKKRKRLN